MCVKGTPTSSTPALVSSHNHKNRLSRRFHVLGSDSELWKRQYYSQWVRPRARRLANLRCSTLSAKAEYSPKVSTWLDHSHLAEDGRVTNWKRQYRLRHNWSKGLCRVTEVELPEPSAPPMLAKLCAGILFTADASHGLRAWSAKDPAKCMDECSIQAQAEGSVLLPTSLAVSQSLDGYEVVVGFDRGHFHRYSFSTQIAQLRLRSSHVGFSDGAITAMALSSPYLLIVSQHKNLSLYNLGLLSDQLGANLRAANEPSQLASLKADNMVAPMTLSLRASAFEITASVVYSFFHIGCGWSLGIQELRFNKSGRQLDSRLASTVDSQYGIRPLQPLSSVRKRRHSATAEPADPQTSVTSSVPSIVHQRPPTSMSYSHPYLLTSHVDNTLTMYLVVSDSSSLFVRGAQRLWGHTSSVSAVQVTNRGKAVSVSSRGDEIRIWELETTVPSLNGGRPLREENSIQVSPEYQRRKQSRPGCALRDNRWEVGSLGLRSSATPELSQLQECVGFDEERVLLLRERNVGTQLLECYDFT